MAEVRVTLPFHLRRLAQLDGSEVRVDVAPPVTVTSVLDALEAAYPALRGTVRDQATGRRRAMVRLYAGEEDRSLDDPARPLPDAVAESREPLRVVGAIAGG